MMNTINFLKAMDIKPTKIVGKHKCKFCNRDFVKESTLLVHVCEPKRRHQQKNEKEVQLAFIAYKRFYELTQTNQKEPTYEDFANSNYYNAFVKFGRYIFNINAVNPKAFIDYVIKNNKKLDKWCNDKVYEEYLLPYIKNESVQEATERTIITMTKWAEENNSIFAHFFLYSNPNKATHLILNGRISPWVIYNSEHGLELLERLSDEQLELISQVIDPVFWNKKFQKYPEDVNWITNILQQANI